MSLEAPRVYSIRREPPSTLPLTGGAVNVVITLSEEPGAFTADHINVTNATAGTPVALGATSQNTVGLSTVTQHLTTTGAIGDRPVLRTVSELRVVIRDYMNNTVPPPGEFIEAVRALRTAVENKAPAYAYYYNDAAGSQWNKPLKNGAYYTFPLVNDAVAMPRKQGTAPLAVTAPVALTIPAATFYRSAAELAVPNADFATLAAYNFALARYNAWNGPVADNQRDAYTKEKLAYDKYIELQSALQAYDVRQQQEWDQELATTASSEQVVPQNSLPPTGRDGLLHPYSVTLTPSYANNSPVVVKVNRFPNTDLTPVYYTPPTLETGYREGFDKLTLQVGAGAVIVLPPPPLNVVAPAGFVFAPHGFFTALEREQIQEQIDLLIATGDRSPDTLKTLVYLQQLLATARPEKTQLFANYPNPFNPETWIPYELATDTNVRLSRYTTRKVL